MVMTTVWLILFVAFVVAEIATSAALVSIWFCIGAIAAFFSAKAGMSLFVQLVVFIVVSVAMLVLTKPFVKKVVHKTERTNADRILGNKAIVTEQIDNIKATGAIKVDGKQWTARSKTQQVIEVGQLVTVLEIQGVKAIVDIETASEHK